MISLKKVFHVQPAASSGIGSAICKRIVERHRGHMGGIAAGPVAAFPFILSSASQRKKAGFVDSKIMLA